MCRRLMPNACSRTCARRFRWLGACCRPARGSATPCCRSSMRRRSRRRFDSRSTIQDLRFAPTCTSTFTCSSRTQRPLLCPPMRSSPRDCAPACSSSAAPACSSRARSAPAAGSATASKSSTAWSPGTASSPPAHSSSTPKRGCTAMINKGIDLSAKHRVAVVVLALAGALAGWFSLRQVPLDALPDLSDTQVIIYSTWDRSPDLIEDQVTYPIVTALLGAPRVKAVRGISDFGYSFVYVVFEDGTDLYWARSRTLEYLAGVLSTLPPGVKTELGPDATGLGWVFQYALTDDSGKLSPSELRTTQDFFLRYHLRSVPGVAEVASVGGFVPQYQVTVDPARLRAVGIPFATVVEAVRRSNVETGGRVMEFGGSEYMIRGRGYLGDPRDLEEAVVTGGGNSQIVRVKDVGKVTLGPEMRRGVADLDGRGETVSGIVVMRQGANVVDVIDRVKRKL